LKVVERGVGCARDYDLRSIRRRAVLGLEVEIDEAGDGQVFHEIYFDGAGTVMVHTREGFAGGRVVTVLVVLARGGAAGTIKVMTTQSIAKNNAKSWAVVSSPLGVLGLVKGPKGIEVVSLGSSEEEVRAGLIAEVGDVLGAPGRLSETAALRALAAGKKAVTPKVNARGTEFQRQVWDVVAAIPRGETRSYAEVARAVGRPNAVRAVGSALARNPIPLVVPCHRVVHTGGHVGNYRFGSDVKERLLRSEGVVL
jgi:O-6-methylguanine DNA methyltransferase